MTAEEQVLRAEKQVLRAEKKAQKAEENALASRRELELFEYFEHTNKRMKNAANALLRPMKECPLCFEEDLQGVLLPCGHLLCEGCVKSYCEVNGCPTCEAKVTHVIVVKKL